MAVRLDAAGDLPDLSLLREESREELLEILRAYPGTKCLVLDPDITGLVNHVVVEGSQLLREHGVVLFQELTGRLGRLGVDDAGGMPEHVLFLARPRVLRAQQVAAQIKTWARVEPQRHYGVFFVPHRTLACEQVLEDEGVLRSVTIGEFHMDLVPFDRDVVSMELGHAFRELFVDEDATALGSVARALSKWQAIYGVIPSVKCKGDLARQALQRLLRMRVDDELTDASPPDDAGVAGAGAPGGSAVHMMVLMDRGVDMVTPLVTPLTYEGLIDELLSIQNSQVKLDASLVDTGDELPGEAPEKKAGERPAPEAKTEVRPSKLSLPLNSNDELYAEIRDKNVSALGHILQGRAKSVKDLYSGFRSNRNASVSEIAAFWKQVPELKARYKSLSQHINVAAELKKTTDSNAFRERWQIERGLLEGEVHVEAIEEAIYAEEPATEVLKLLCLQSLCAGGLRSKHFDSLRRDFLQTYGFGYLLVLTALERMGVLKRKESFLDTGSTVWSSLRRSFTLINDDDTDVMNPRDMTYVTSGYAPLSARLVQFAVAPSWTDCQDALRVVPGVGVQLRQGPVPQELEPSVAQYREADERQRPPVRSTNGKKPCLLVFYIGGVTYLEIAALRHLSRSPTFPYSILILTTKVINGATLLQSMSSHVSGDA